MTSLPRRFIANGLGVRGNHTLSHSVSTLGLSP
jgi:hypothetical protein